MTSLAFYLFLPNRLIKSIKHEHSYKILHLKTITLLFCITGQRTHDSDRQFEIFSLDKDVIAGEKYYIEMNFTGPLTGDLAGFYLSTYQRGNDTV